MMGLQETKRELFVLISLNEYVPEDHLLRAVDQYLDLSAFRENLAQSYSHTGRPSVDPELMARMLIIGYCYGIRSERRLCEEVGMNLAYRWFCRLGLKDKVPDHSSFSKNIKPQRLVGDTNYGVATMLGEPLQLVQAGKGKENVDCYLLFYTIPTQLILGLKEEYPMDVETKKLIDKINMNKAPCYDQTAEEVENWLRTNVQVGAQVIVRHGQGGIIQYIKANVIRLGRGRFEVDSIGEQSLSPASNSFYYSGKNCWHPKGQTRLVAATEKVLEATAGDGIYEHRYASTTV